MTTFTRLLAGSLGLLSVPVAAFCYDAGSIPAAVAPTAAPGLANATILIVRHAEKPSEGAGLDPKGVARSQAYVDYFRNFRLGGIPVHIDTLIATADSPNSERPKLTLSPLSRSMHIPIQQPFGNDAVGDFADWLKTAPRGHNILIAWHHGQIPYLVRELGADPAQLFTFSRWWPGIYDQVVVLRFDGSGHVIPGETRLVREGLPV